MTVRYLVLWPTAACDLACPYCYRRNRRGGRMSIEVADAALDLVADGVRGTGRPAHVQLAGGEPTLVPDLVEHVARRVAAIRGGRVTCGIQTNATHLDGDMVAILRRHRVRVGVSLDGPPQVQEQARGSAASTFRGLLELARADVPVRVTTVLSALNVDHLGELAVTLGGLPNVTGFGLDPLVPIGSAAGREDLVPSEEAVVAGITALHRCLAQVNAMRADPLRWRELETVRAALRHAPSGPTRPGPGQPRPPATGETSRIRSTYPCCIRTPTPADDSSHTGTSSPRGNPVRNDVNCHADVVDPSGRTHLPLAMPNRPYCHAAVGESLAVAPDGSVYPCSQAVGDVASRVGTIDDVDWDGLRRRFAHDVHTLRGPCHRCALADRCPGDCPSRAEANALADPEHRHTPLTCLIDDTLARLEIAS
ncbi:radical SAM/SPASM domain-containing protein [uncultured Cutibacterium sp.]|uniref:radical SAM/SPASM domain-containing protein n=1 Tax=uncultured Cutibacterium sp. TaxID=1912223 RepID=UPI002803D11A|nr:radical SAM protein [uncultured Cutibacterium sp.]MDU1581636.1 radical SAM protein [Cutibacterium granulosum]